MTNQLFDSNWTSIVFEGRNKRYGAYLLRKEYEGNMLKALIVSIAFGAFITVSSIVLSNKVNVSAALGERETIVELFPPIDPKIHELAQPKLPQVQQSNKSSTTEHNRIADLPFEATIAEIPAKVDDTGSSNAGREAEGPIVESESGGGALPVKKPTALDTLPKEPVSFAEVMPAFDGNIQTYIAQHLTYPRSAVENSVEGKLYVELIIDEFGNVAKFKIVKSLGYGCDEEALKMVSSMPKWSPAKMANKPVKAKVVIPISFRLN